MEYTIKKLEGTNADYGIFASKKYLEIKGEFCTALNKTLEMEGKEQSSGLTDITLENPGQFPEGAEELTKRVCNAYNYLLGINTAANRERITTEEIELSQQFK